MHSRASAATVSATSLVLLAAMILNPPVAGAQATCAQEIASIQTYSKRIDQLIKQRQSPVSKRIFARLTSDARERAGEWVELDVEQSIARFDESAFAWVIERKMIAALITVQSRSQNWVHRVMYYYREDGSLARISSTLDSFAGASIVVREQFYDKGGLSFSKSSRHYTLRRASKGGAVEQTILVYLRINELPFQRGMGRFADPTHSR